MYAPGESARVLADKLDEHRNFVRLAVFERAGVLTWINVSECGGAWRAPI